MTAFVNLPDINDELVKQGMEPFVSTPEEFGAKIRAGHGQLRPFRPYGPHQDAAVVTGEAATQS